MENKIKKILVGIDASRSNTAQRTGTEYYSFEIIKEILKQRDERFDLRLYSKTPLDYVKSDLGVENRVMSFPRLWSQIRLSYEIMQNPPDVLFVPAHTIPIYHGKKTVVTLHDIGFKYFPELYTPLERYYHDWCMKFSVRHASEIIAISEATKKDLVAMYKADPKKITVIYHGYDEKKYFPKKESITKINEVSPYIYFIGRLEAKKNIKTLIKAFEILKHDPEVKHKLVLAGRPGYMYEEIEEHISRTSEKVRKDIVELGYVADEDAPAYMRNADIFAFPSNFEGFGMPLVEAMASGVPVVAANTTSIPEIIGGAGLLHEVHDENDLAKKLAVLIKNRDEYKKYQELGLKRASNFKWSEAAKKTLEVIKRANSD